MRNTRVPVINISEGDERRRVVTNQLAQAGATGAQPLRQHIEVNP
jgi:hypothetical protein